MFRIFFLGELMLSCSVWIKLHL